MAKEKSSAAWTVTCTKEACEPVGPIEAARRAVNLLGPFKFRTQDEASHHAPPRNAIRMGVSQELAIDRVYALATMFNRVQILTDGAPRRKDVVESLDKLENAAAAFADVLESLDDITRHRLQTGGTGMGLFKKFFPNELMKNDLMKQANVDGLPRPSGDGEEGTQCQWIIQARALSQYAGAVRTNFFISKGIEDPDRVDRGGNTNLIKEDFGSARYQLVQEGWHVYDLFKPDEQTGTEGGPFHLFLCAIFEFATGQLAEEHSKLMPLVKKACNINRELKALCLQENQLLCELNVLPPTRANQPRLREIEQEVQELSDKIYALHAEIWPSGGSRSRPGNIPRAVGAP
jgi:hypothetical protein